MDGDGAVLCLRGELADGGAVLLVVEAERLVRQGHRHLVLDCAAVTLCDFVGLRTMMHLWDRVQPDGSVTVTRASTAVAHILDSSGLAGRFKIAVDTCDSFAEGGESDGRAGGRVPSGLLDGKAVEAELAAECLAFALTSTVVIEQAKGVLSERTGLDMDQTFALLRDHATHHRVALVDVAQRIVDGTSGTATLDPLY